MYIDCSPVVLGFAAQIARHVLAWLRPSHRHLFLWEHYRGGMKVTVVVAGQDVGKSALGLWPSIIFYLSMNCT